MIAEFEPQALRDLDLFAGMLDREIKELLDVCELETVAAGETIYEPGKRRQALYVLMEGALEVDLPVPGGNERMLLQIVPQGAFGEVSFFHSAPHTAIVRCVKDAHLLRLDRSNFDQLAEQGSSAALKLAMNAARLLAARLAMTDGWMGSLVAKMEQADVADHWRKFREGVTPSGMRASGMVGLPGAW